MLPGISCTCLTYGRPKRVLEEAVHSFLKQDYEGPKELLVLNDLGEQFVRFDHPEVTVVNVAQRFRTVGEKRNAAVALCCHDLIAVWDDDDIYLPHRLSFSVRQVMGKRYFKPREALRWDSGKLSGPTHFLLHAGSIWERSLFDEVGGYPHIDSGQDWGLEEKFQKLGLYEETETKPEEIFYLYRWHGTGSFHLSHEGKKARTGHDALRDYVLDQIGRGNIGIGDVMLKPHWATDYVKLAREYLQRDDVLNA